MSEAPIDLDAKRVMHTRLKPITPRDAGDLHQREVPERDWLIPSVLIRRSITLLAGDGGVGKSLLCQQLQVAAALGVDWLGIPIKEKLTSLAVYCEDDEDELHRRYWDICRHYGVQFSDIERRVLYLCGVGEDDNELVEFRGKGEYGKPTKTSRFAQIMEIIRDYEVQMTILDTISDVFAGNENIRYQVKAFVTMIRSMSLPNNGGVIMTSHPSKSAMVDGSGFSGSTAWNGAVRNRLYLTARKVKDEDGEAAPTDDRVLKIMKSNYGPFGEKIKVKWQGGAFVRTEGSQQSGLVDKLDHNRLLLSAAEWLIKNGEYLSPEQNSRTSLMTLSRTLPSCAHLTFEQARDAQYRLIESGQLVKVEAKRDRKWRSSIRPSFMSYGEEQNP